jgi:hypothetical protein
VLCPLHVRNRTPVATDRAKRATRRPPSSDFRLPRSANHEHVAGAVLDDP